jgi:aspartate/methionine/tyrosine aminotransferase
VPQHPRVSPAAAVLPAVSYAPAPSAAAAGRALYPLHLGDTWRSPPDGCRLEDFAAARHRDLYRYAPPRGLAALVDALVERTRAATGVAVGRRNLLVTAGATAGCAAVLGALVAPGEEVLMLAPRWPLVAGMARVFGAVPVDVPALGVRSAEELVARVEARAGERTVALYLNSPNNPSGAVLPRAAVEALVAWAGRRDLWVLADEVFGSFVYAGVGGDGSDGSEGVYRGDGDGKPAGAFGLAPERTFVLGSFSKTYGMAGNRCGWVVGPLPAMAEVTKVNTQLVYAAPTAAQLAALAALGGAGDAWLAAARRQYRETGALVAARLGAPAPQGATFLFLDAAASLDGGGLPAFLRRCAARGLLLAPGPSFGPYPTHVRLCFSAAPPLVVERGAELLAGLLGR